MRRRWVSVLASATLVWTLLATGTQPVSAAGILRNPGSPSYEVSLSTGPHGRVWRGHETIAFRNVGTKPLPLVWLRLWSNGVKGCPGAIRIDHLIGGTPNGAVRRCTAVRVDLDAAVAPDDTGSISMHLEIRVPKRNDRFGSHAGLTLLGTALPILAIRDDQGWHLDPFVDLGESFYSIAGRYRVRLNTPRGLDTPTTGVRVDRYTPTPDRVVTTYAARNVRDFAWAAGYLRRASAPVGSTRVTVWYQEAGIDDATLKAALHTARISLRTYSRAFGLFPYREMDVVLTAFGSFGGMEYPTIVFTNPVPIIIAHEIAHQWWFGIVGDNEFAEPWLDESFATWAEYLPFDPWKACSGYIFPSGTARITNDMAYWKANPNEYGTIYFGGGCMLANLAHRFGLDRFTRILHAYAGRHWFGVARTDEFKTAIEKAAGKYLASFDAPAFWATWRVD